MSIVSDLQEEVAALEQWRALALQFDRHRMQAIAHLKALTLDPSVENAVAASKFLSAPPVPYHEITVRLAKLEAVQSIARMCDCNQGRLPCGCKGETHAR